MTQAGLKKFFFDKILIEVQTLSPDRRILSANSILHLTRCAKAVIFDVDGTLYNQEKLRLLMLMEMLRWSARHPRGVGDFRILLDFRKAREANACRALGEIVVLQYQWGAERSGVSVEKVRLVVQEWMFRRPLRHLPACCRPGIRELFSALRHRKILIGVFSDYPAEAKLSVLRLQPDVVVSAVDADVNRFKPDPKGLIVTASKLGMPKEQCIFIGDRDDKDGECARRAGMPYLILNRRKTNFDGCKIGKNQ